MKELSIEEKAKHYDEAYKKVAVRFGSNVADEIFPELRESEDERIRKMLIEQMKRWHKCALENNVVQDIKDSADAITWLENHEQKPDGWSEEDEEISEAIIKRISGKSDTLRVSLSSAISWVENVKDRVQPKQEWSEEDIELLNNTIKFIEDSVAATSPSLRTYNPTLTGKEIPFLKSIKDKVQPKQEWSEKDEERIKNIISVLDVQVCWDGATGKKGNPYQKEIDWLKSLKSRIQPRPQQKWSEEDESILQGIWDEILANKHNAKRCEWKTYDKFLDWLNSLRPQNRWKPSDEQMEALDFAADCIVPAEFCFKRNELKGLLEQLQKLKG